MSKRVFLTLEDKVGVLKDNEKGVSERKLATNFKCSKSQINRILKNKEIILKEWNENKHRGIKRKQDGKFEEINVMVYDWFRTVRSKNIPVSGPILQEKALQIATQLGIIHFKASNGWLEKFRARHNIQFRVASGEKGDVNLERCDEWRSRLTSLIEGYNLKDIFNMDETGLFFKCLPSKTLTLKASECTGGKMSKDRITVMLCASVTGEKMPALIIAKSKNPRCFKGADPNKLGVDYFYNNKAWMTSIIFEKWLKEFDKKMRCQNRKVLLFMDNAPCHIADFNLKNVEIKFLPPQTTSVLQPMDQGIIQSFKLNYRKKIMKSVLARMDESCNSSDLAKKTTLYEAIAWIVEAWKETKELTIRKCFKNCGFARTMNFIDDCSVEESLDSDLNENSDEQDLIQMALSQGMDNIDFLSCIEEENQVECFGDIEKLDNLEEETDENTQMDVAVNPVQILRQIKELQNSLASVEGVINPLKHISNLNILSSELENVILNRKIQNTKQKQITDYFSNI